MRRSKVLARGTELIVFLDAVQKRSRKWFSRERYRWFLRGLEIGNPNAMSDLCSILGFIEVCVLVVGEEP